MTKWVMVVTTNCTDATRKAEFNEWYNKIHLPDILETPGFTRATRYENIEPLEGEARFLAIYDIEADDIDEVMKTHDENMVRKRAEGRFSELVVRVSRNVYRQVSSFSK